MSVIGYAPMHLDDQTGEVWVNPNESVGSTDDDDGSDGVGRVYWPFGRQARLRRIGRRLDRLSARQERLAPTEEIAEEAPVISESPADLYQAAAAQGMVQENQYNGLGFVTVPKGAPGATATLSDTINRNLWGKSLVLDSDAPAVVLVTSITVAGLPINVGNKGTPLAMFATNSTRFGISFGRKLALVGQSVVVSLQNIDAGVDHIATGGIIADEMNPYAMQRLWEKMLLTAAVDYDGAY